MAKSIDEIYNQRPSIIRNSFVIKLVQILAIVLMILFFAVGIGLILTPEIISEAMEKLIAIDFDTEAGTTVEQMKRLMYFFGFLSLLASVVLGILAYFTRLILTRNRFIKNLESWFTEQYNNGQEGVIDTSNKN